MAAFNRTTAETFVAAIMNGGDATYAEAHIARDPAGTLGVRALQWIVSASPTVTGSWVFINNDDGTVSINPA